MDESAETFANRDEPIPLLQVPIDGIDLSSDETDSGYRSRLKSKLSRERFKAKAQELHANYSEKRAKSPSGRPTLQDRLFSKILEQVIPVEGDYPDVEDSKVDRRSSQYVNRPAFSLGVMSNNFRRFNARIGIVFVFQNQLIRLFTWTTASHTLSFLAVYTFVCLDPYLLIVLPPVVALLFIMVPAFMARHPPPPPPPKASAARPDQVTSYSYSGPAIAPARTIKPAAETSKDFFRNMRDLQNCMADFANIHDLLVTNVAPVTNFSDEVLSSTLFLYLFMVTCLFFVSAHLLPLRAISLVGGYTLVISGHPAAQKWILKQQKKVERQAALYSDTLQVSPANAYKTPGPGPLPSTPSLKPPTFYGIPFPNNSTTRAISNTITSISEITLATAPETAEIEIFELQHRDLLPPGTTGTTTSSLYNPRGSTSSSKSTPATEWQSYLFTPTPYDPLSPLRISGSRPVGTRFFEDVQPPPGWTFHTPKWELDLEAGEWVSERLIVGVEYDVLRHDPVDPTDPNEPQRRESINADFGGWVWDLPPVNTSTTSGLERDEEVWLAYGDYNFADLEKKDRKRSNSKKTQKKEEVHRDWEEQIKYGGRGRTGEWRRRRWVRVVSRKPMLAKREK